MFVTWFSFYMFWPILFKFILYAFVFVLLLCAANELHNTHKYLFDSSVDRERSRLLGNITDLDLVRIWESDGHGHGQGQSVYVLPAWYVIVDRSTRRLHAVDPLVYRRLATAAANILAGQWRQSLLKSGGGLRRSNRDVESTTTYVRLPQLLMPQQRVLSKTYAPLLP